jgi:predicted  nucleic acid-binding Zn-ribbon protein
MPDQSQELLKLKQHIDKSKTESARIEGQITQLEKQRAEEFGCATDEEATSYIQELESDVARLEKEIEEGVATVKGELNW